MNCPRCNTPLPEDAAADSVGGLCPKCLLHRVSRTQHNSPHHPLPLELVPTHPRRTRPLLPRPRHPIPPRRGGMGRNLQGPPKIPSTASRRPPNPPPSKCPTTQTGGGSPPASPTKPRPSPNSTTPTSSPSTTSANGEEHQAPAPPPAAPSPSPLPPTPSIYFFLMEFIDGLSLRQLLNTSTPYPNSPQHRTRRHRPPDLRRSPIRPRPRHRPPRHQTRKHPPHPIRPNQNRRLRPRHHYRSFPF